jgi:hypothetical protein
VSRGGRHRAGAFSRSRRHGSSRRPVILERLDADGVTRRAATAACSAARSGRYEQPTA